MRFIKTNFDLCTGCRICQLVCSERLFGGYNPRRSVLSIRDSRENLVHEPVVCHHCENPFCKSVCPTGAISRNETTGAMIIDRQTCIGCGLCQKYCPLGVIFRDTEMKKSFKCDLCEGKPECVQVCPTGALELVEAEVVHE